MEAALVASCTIERFRWSLSFATTIASRSRDYIDSLVWQACCIRGTCSPEGSHRSGCLVAFVHGKHSELPQKASWCSEALASRFRKTSMEGWRYISSEEYISFQTPGSMSGCSPLCNAMQTFHHIDFLLSVGDVRLRGSSLNHTKRNGELQSEAIFFSPCKFCGSVPMAAL